MGMYDGVEELALELFYDTYGEELFELYFEERFGDIDIITDNVFDYPYVSIDDIWDDSIENYERTTDVYVNSPKIKLTEEDWESLLEFMSDIEKEG